MQWLVEAINAGGAAMLAAWPQFLAAVAAVGIVIWFLMRVRYEGAFSAKDATIQHLERRLKDSEAKLEGLTPAEAKARMDALEEALAAIHGAIKPRQLTPEQRAIIVEKAKHPGGLPAKVLIHTDSSAPDTFSYARQLRLAFRDADWEVGGSNFIGTQRHSEKGMFVGVSDPANLTDAEEVAVRALRAAGIECEVVFDSERGMADPPPLQIQLTYIERG